MIIDPKNDKEKLQAQTAMTRTMAGLEVVGRRRFLKLLNKQYLKASRLVSQGVMNVDYAITQDAGLMAETFIAYYLKISKVFGDFFNDALKAVERKDAESDFKRIIHDWATTQAAQKVAKVQQTTKKALAKIINKGMSDGLSNREIASDILKSGKITNPHRASVIARNETHTGSVHAVQKSAEVSRVEMEREWVAKLDERTRGVDPNDKFSHIRADGERVGMKEVFTRTGEALMYPGDPNGSAANTIQCRCVVVYHRVSEMKPNIVREEF